MAFFSHCLVWTYILSINFNTSIYFLSFLASGTKMRAQYFSEETKPLKNFLWSICVCVCIQEDWQSWWLIAKSVSDHNYLYPPHQRQNQPEILGDEQSGSNSHLAKNRFRLNFDGLVRSKDRNTCFSVIYLPQVLKIAHIVSNLTVS